MIRIIADPEKIVPWLDSMGAHGRKLLELPRGTRDEMTHAEQTAHSWYLVLFHGFKKAFSTTEQEELNLNHVIMRAAYVGQLDENREEAFRVQVTGMLALIDEARELCQKHA